MPFYYNGELVGGPRGPAGPDGNPIGTVVSFLGFYAPADYLPCDGAEHPVADYPDLAAFFAEQFGSPNRFGGDGTATFAVPDLPAASDGSLFHYIKAVESASVLEEYDDGGWHVRKWADGYVEMAFSGEAAVDITIAAGSLYQCVGFGSQEYPVPLVHKYAELRDVSASVAVIPTYSYGAETDPLKSTCAINLYRPMVAPNYKAAYSFFVAGRWK